MNVLSLFDGISCGQLALRQAGVPVENYYASEIDQRAISVTQKHFPNTIQLGDVTNWRAWNLPKIDLLIAGSPCQGFSTAGKQLNFDDPRSRLFFDFVDIKNHFDQKWWLLENVKMKQEWQDTISESVGCNPIFINSADFSAQFRQRMYWTNIPILPWEEIGITLTDVLDFGWKTDRRKSYCVDAMYGKGSNVRRYLFKHSRQLVFKEFPPCSLTIDDANEWGRQHKDDWRILTPEECERLQTLPIGYTDCGLSKFDRYHAIGNGWTVGVINHIFRGLVPNQEMRK